MFPLTHSTLAALLTAGLTCAQGAIANGNVNYAVTTVPATQTAITARATFGANPTLSNRNVLFAHWWYYRLAGDTREFTFNGSSGQLQQSYLGNTATLHWANVDFRNQMSATWTIQLTSTGATSGIAQSQMSIRNISPAPITLNLFSYGDVDLCTNTSNSVVGNPGPDRHLITSTVCPAERVEHVGQGHDRFEVQTFPTLVNRLGDALIDDLSDSGLPYGPGDYSAAFQWQNRTLLPNQTATFTVLLVHNTPAALGQISDNNVSYTMVSVPSSPSSAGGQVAFTANAPAVTNALDQQWWYYRLDNDTRESAFNDGGGQMQQSYVGNTATLTWPDVDQRNLVSASLTIQVQSTGPSSGLATSQMSITNLTNQPRRLSLFAYGDVNLCGTTNGAVPSPGPYRHLVTSAGCPSESIQHEAQGHDRYEVQGFAQLRNRLVDPVIDTLGNVGLPFPPGDYTGAFQWQDRILGPLQTMTFMVVVSHNGGVPRLGQVTDANASYTVYSVPNTPSSTGGRIGFTANPGVADSIATQHWWYYRLNADGREFAFNDGNGQLAQSYIGNTAVFDWANADQRGIRAQWMLTVQSTGPTAGYAVSRMTVTNNTASPLTLSLFAHGNLDLCLSPATDVAGGNPGTDRHRVQSTSSCGERGEFFGSRPDHYQVQPFPVLVNRLTDGALDGLADTGLPFGPGDYAAAFEWRNRVVQPGRSLTVEVALGHNANAPAGGRIKRVAPIGQPYQQISDAIADCVPGDVILVSAGTYDPFVLDKGVSILGRIGANPVVLGESRVRAIPAGQVAALGGLVLRSRDWQPTSTDQYALLVEPGAGSVVIESCTVETGPVIWRDQGAPAPVAAMSVADCTTLLDRVTVRGTSGTHGLVAAQASPLRPLVIAGGTYRGGDSDCGLFCFPDINPPGAAIVFSAGGSTSGAYLSEVVATGGAVVNNTRTSEGGAGLLALGGNVFVRSGTISGGTGGVHPGNFGGTGLITATGATVHLDGVVNVVFRPGAAGSGQGQPGQSVAGSGALVARLLAALTYNAPFFNLGAPTTVTMRGRPGEPHVLFLGLNLSPLPPLPGIPEPLFLLPPNVTVGATVMDGTGQGGFTVAAPFDLTLFGVSVLFQGIGLGTTQPIIVGPGVGTILHSAAVQ